MNAQKVDVKFGEWIQKGFDLFKENVGLLIVTNLIAMLLGGLTMGVLSGPLYAGVILITLALVDKREPKPEIGEVFKGFEHFLQAFLFVLVWGAILGGASVILTAVFCVGQILQIALALAAGPVLMFGLFLIVDKKMDFWPASMASLEIAKQNFFPLLGLYVVTAAIASVGLLVCCVGVVASAPIACCILAVAYRDIMSGGAAEAQPAATAEAQLAPPAEPPPAQPPQP